MRKGSSRFASPLLKTHSGINPASSWLKAPRPPRSAMNSVFASQRRLPTVYLCARHESLEDRLAFLRSTRRLGAIRSGCSRHSPLGSNNAHASVGRSTGLLAPPHGGRTAHSQAATARATVDGDHRQAAWCHSGRQDLPAGRQRRRRGLRHVGVRRTCAANSCAWATGRPMVNARWVRSTLSSSTHDIAPSGVPRPIMARITGLGGDGGDLTFGLFGFAPP